MIVVIVVWKEKDVFRFCCIENFIKNARLYSPSFWKKEAYEWMGHKEDEVIICSIMILVMEAV